ncbi:MAG: exodeoxyribonuclease VII large subunit [Prevotella sp.]
MKNENRQALTLFELNGMVREVIELSLSQSYWVEAEISEVREVRGHCFMQLVENDPFLTTPDARAEAKCWASQWRQLKPKFERVTREPIHAGMNVLLLVTAQFHEAYGFSWIIEDIDPTFTLGDMARRRAEIITKLKEEGVFDLQKGLTLPLLPQRIAVISSAGAAGYGDFCAQLSDNPYGLQFLTVLFPAVMQGELVESSIISALNKINARQDEFDAVVIIRGGGATSDLSGFDTLALAENVANFPLPVITGIGHQRDESIIDLVAFRSLKTPTAVAAFFVDCLSALFERLQKLEDRILHLAQQRLNFEHIRFNHLREKTPIVFKLMSSNQQQKIRQLQVRLNNSSRLRLEKNRQKLLIIENTLLPHARNMIQLQTHRLKLLEEQLKLNDPQNLLKKGFSITTVDGKIVKDVSRLHEGQCVLTQVEKGNFTSEIKKIHHP